MSTSGINIPYRGAARALGVNMTRFAFSCYMLGILLLIFSWSNTVKLYLGPLLAILGLDASQSDKLAMFMVTVLYVLALTSIGLANYLSDSSIGLNSDLIRFPVSCLLTLKGRRERLWSDLKHVTVISIDVSATKSRLLLHYQSGGYASLNLNILKPDEQEQLLLSIETRATYATKSSEFETLLDSVHNEKLNAGELSFTQIWETDMNRHFSPVAFIPLEPGYVSATGKLKIIRQLTFGGFSAVYLAQRGEDRVVLKEAVIPGNVDPKLKEKAELMLANEAKLLQQNSHPQIVKVLDFYVENGKSYLALEHAPGETLRQMVAREGRLSEDEACDWAYQLANILAHLHNQNPKILHRDISPDNIIVSNDGQLKLIDFGAANEFLSTATGTVVGKQAYISPEQFKGKTCTQSDIYGLGATLHFMLTGKDPEPLTQSFPQTENDKISTSTNNLVASCTDLDLETRTKTAEDIASLLTLTLSSDGTKIQWKNKQVVPG